LAEAPTRIDAAMPKAKARGVRDARERTVMRLTLCGKPAALWLETQPERPGPTSSATGALARPPRRTRRRNGRSGEAERRPPDALQTGLRALWTTQGAACARKARRESRREQVMEPSGSCDFLHSSEPTLRWREVRKPAHRVPNDREPWKLATSTSPRPDPDPAPSLPQNSSSSQRLAAWSCRDRSRTSRPAPVGRLRRFRGFGTPSVAPASAARRRRRPDLGPRTQAVTPGLPCPGPGLRRPPRPDPQNPGQSLRSPSRFSRPTSAEHPRPT